MQNNLSTKTIVSIEVTAIRLTLLKSVWFKYLWCSCRGVKVYKFSVHNFHSSPLLYIFLTGKTFLKLSLIVRLSSKLTPG